MSNGLKTNERLQNLRPILNEWIAINEQMGRDWAEIGDVPWWYNERALVSLFAGAVWRQRGHAMEEYAEEKRGDDRKVSGRCDLWFSFRDEDYKAETKQCWLRTSSDVALKSAQESMRLAEHDVSACEPDNMHSLAMVFGVPIIPKSQLVKLPDHIKAMEAVALDQSMEADSVVWIFSTLKDQPISFDGYICPGIILWIKEIRRSKRA